VNVRKRGRRYSVEVYDPSFGSRKRYVGTYATEREAKEAGRAAEADVARRRGRRGDETVAGWATRWLVLKPRQKESTNIGYREQVRAFAERHGSLRLRDVDVELALEWLGEKRWTHGGLRAMFTDARHAGLIDDNPFAGLRLRGTGGRRNLDVLPEADVHTLCDCALEVWEAEVGLTMRALISVAAFVGMRPAEIYGLRWADLDLRAEEVHVERQYSARTRSFELPKNGLTRTVVLTAPAKVALMDLPRPVNAQELIRHLVFPASGHPFACGPGLRNVRLPKGSPNTRRAPRLRWGARVRGELRSGCRPIGTTAPSCSSTRAPRRFAASGCVA